MPSAIDPIHVLFIFLAALSFTFMWRIFRPRVIAFPWKKIADNSTKAKREKEEVVILAGSYNPPHYGHLAMLSYLAERYGAVVAVIGVNPNKSYQVSPHARAALLRTMLQSKSIPKNIKVQTTEGYIWRYAQKIKATTFFRGIRSWDADGPAERSLHILNTWGPIVYGPLVWPIPTVYLEGDPRFNDVSSTKVRELCCKNETMGDEKNVKEQLKKLVPDDVVNEVLRLYSS